jgi:hypothetical protein
MVKTQEISVETGIFPLTKPAQGLKVELGAVHRTRINTGVFFLPAPWEWRRSTVLVAAMGPNPQVRSRFRFQSSSDPHNKKSEQQEGVTTWQRE